MSSQSIRRPDPDPVITQKDSGYEQRPVALAPPHASFRYRRRIHCNAMPYGSGHINDTYRAEFRHAGSVARTAISCSALIRNIFKNRSPR
jgi:hypothetical protein